ERRIRSFGVDTSRVLWEEDGRAGLYFIEPAAAPRRARVLYDRARSSASRMRPEEIGWSVLDSVRHVHLTGITPALSDSCRVTVALGAEGALCHDGQVRSAASFSVREVDRVGAGDAFDAGLLFGFLQGDLDQGIAYGMAMAGLKHSIPGDEFVATREEVESLL